MRILITLFLLSFILAGSQAQDGAIADIESVRLATQESIDQSVFMDEEERICYVDLEKVPYVLTQAVIIDKEGTEVVSKSLSQERVDTIVELEYGTLPSGSYILELRSHRGKTVKALHL